MALFHHSGGGKEKAARDGPASRQHSPELVRIGAYLHSAEDLYRVEAVSGERALVEDCRSGDLIYLPLSELLSLEPVRANDRCAPHTA
jgi:hypothetical protein